VVRAKCGGEEFPNVRSGEHNIQKLLARRHSGDIFPLGLHFGGYNECVVAVVILEAKVRSCRLSIGQATENIGSALAGLFRLADATTALGGPFVSTRSLRPRCNENVFILCENIYVPSNLQALVRVNTYVLYRCPEDCEEISLDDELRHPRRSMICIIARCTDKPPVLTTTMSSLIPSQISNFPLRQFISSVDYRTFSQ
jgi:hypothetical protein